MEDPNDALHDPDPAADKRRCYTVRRSVALSAYWYERVRQVATSTNLKPGVILRNAIKLGLVQLAAGTTGGRKAGPVRRLGTIGGRGGRASRRESLVAAGRVRRRAMRLVTTGSRRAGGGRWGDGQDRTAKGLRACV